MSTLIAGQTFVFHMKVGPFYYIRTQYSLLLNDGTGIKLYTVESSNMDLIPGILGWKKVFNKHWPRFTLKISGKYAFLGEQTLQTWPPGIVKWLKDTSNSDADCSPCSWDDQQSQQNCLHITNYWLIYLWLLGLMSHENNKCLQIGIVVKKRQQARTF